jgi:hypothetical protein
MMRSNTRGFDTAARPFARTSGQRLMQVVTISIVSLVMPFAALHAQTQSPVSAQASASPQSDVSKSTQPFLVFPDTKSPDGRYAIAWGLPKHPEIWAKVSRFQEQHPAGTEASSEEDKQLDELFESVNVVGDAVENYVIDLRAGTIIRKLDCPRLPGWTHGREAEPDYWTIADRKPNRHDLQVVWSPQSDLVLINHTWRWDSVTFCAVMLSDGRATSELDLNRPLGDAVRNLVAKSFPRGFQYTKKDLNVAFSDVKQVGDNKFSAVADAVVEKYWSGGGAKIDFTLLPASKGKTLKLVGVRAQ